MPKNNIVKTDGTIDYNHLGVMDDNITTHETRLTTAEGNIASNSNQIGNLTNKAAGVFNAKEFGITNNNTDISSLLLQAFSQLNDGDTIQFPNGDYLISSFVQTNKLINLKGGRKTRFKLGDMSMTKMIQFGNETNEGALVALTVAALKGDDNITVSSVTGISVGDYLLIQSDERVTPTFSPSDWRKGEILRVRSIDTTNKVITFYSRLMDSYGTAYNAGYRQMTMLNDLSIENIQFVNPYPNQTNCMFLKVLNAVNVNIDKVRMTGGDMAGLTLWNVIRSNVSKVVCEDFVNNQTSPNNRYGYGISVERASQQITISDCHFARCRHSFTTNGGNSDPYRSGIPRFINVVDCTSVDGSQAQFDTHPIGEYITFDNCSVQGARYQADPYGTQYGDSWGFQVRANKVRLINPQVTGTDIGIIVDIAATDTQIINPTISDTKDLAIELRWETVTSGISDGRGYTKRTLIQGGKLINIGTSFILVGDTSQDVTIMGVYMDGCGKVTSGKNGVDVGGNAGKVRVMGCWIHDSFGGGTMLNGINFAANSYDCTAFNNRIKDMTGSRVAYPTSTSWVASTSYSVGAIVQANGYLYICTVAGTSGSIAPSFTSGTATDGTVTWQYRGKIPLNITDFDDNGQFRLAHNLIGGGALTTFDVGAENGKPIRFNRNSSGNAQFMFNKSAPDVEIVSGGHINAKGYLQTGAISTVTAVNNSFFVDSADNKLKFKDNTGTIKVVTLT